MTDTKALRDLLLAATPGVWEYDPFTEYVSIGKTYRDGAVLIALLDDVEMTDADGFFIAAAHNALPALLDELDALRAYKAAHERVLAALPDDMPTMILHPLDEEGSRVVDTLVMQYLLKRQLRAAEAEGGAA